MSQIKVVDMFNLMSGSLYTSFLFISDNRIKDTRVSFTFAIDTFDFSDVTQRQLPQQT